MTYTLFLMVGTQEPSEGLRTLCEIEHKSLAEAKLEGREWHEAGRHRYASIVSDTGSVWEDDEKGKWHSCLRTRQ